MAQSIASFEPKIEVPPALQGVFDRVILARTKVAKWFDEGQSSDPESNKRHSYFIGILDQASKLLQPLISRLETVSEDIKVHNRFASLTVEETDTLDDLIIEVKENQLPKVDPIPIKQDDEELEKEFFFAIASFVEDIYGVRAYIVREWNGYKQTGEGLTRTAILANTTVDLVRSAEHQFEQMLVRPKRFPASDYPVWTLPALLLYRCHHHGFGQFDKNDIDLTIKPSLRTTTNDPEQEAYTMWNVYAGLKMYLHGVTTTFHDSLTPITRAISRVEWTR
jgi:hypothetical protein